MFGSAHQSRAGVNLGRLDQLRATPAALRFVSFEPLLGDLGEIDMSGIGWAITSAESGKGVRSMQMDWVRGIRDQCKAVGVPFFLKQDVNGRGRKISLPELDGRQWREFPNRSNVVEFPRPHHIASTERAEPTTVASPMQLDLFE
jgi:protein gp37